LHWRMVRIRLFEEAAGSLAEAARLPGFLHLYVGQEAVAAGVCATLSDDDQITSTHRGHGHLVAKGGDFNRMMAELMAKSTGYCKGKGGSMHISENLGLKYRTDDEVEQWKQRDPIFTLEDQMVEQGLVDRGEVEAIWEQLRSDIADAISFAESSPEPDVDKLTDDVYTNLDAPAEALS